MGCFLLPLYLKNVKQQIFNFFYLIICARAIILEFGNFLLKENGGRNSWIIWPFSWGSGNGCYLTFLTRFHIFLWWSISSIVGQNFICLMLHNFRLSYDLIRTWPKSSFNCSTHLL
jgi:hypothetical protein